MVACAVMALALWLSRSLSTRSDLEPPGERPVILSAEAEPTRAAPPIPDGVVSLAEAPTVAAHPDDEPAPVAVGTPASPTSTLALQTGVLPWEAALLQIMKAPASHEEKSRALFALLPRMPEEALGTASEQAANWLRDRDYAAFATPLITDPHTHGSILSPLFADLMQRPDSIALPTLLQIARIPGHPFATPARDNLELLLGQHLGTDWTAWEKAVSTRLSSQQ